MSTRKARPKGKCYLCGRMIWAAVAREGGMVRHPNCKPNPTPGRRYGVTH
jgi:uncharacterized protein YycO